MSYYSRLDNYNRYSADSCAQNKQCNNIPINVVPVYSPPGYESLTRGGPCSTDHLEMDQAYAPMCDQYSAQICQPRSMALNAFPNCGPCKMGMNRY